MVFFFLLTVKKTRCKWIAFSRRDAWHLTNTLPTARLSSAGQVEEATSQAPSSRMSSMKQLYRTLYPSTFPIKKTHICSDPLKGRGQNPLLIILSPQERHRELFAV